MSRSCHPFLDYIKTLIPKMDVKSTVCLSDVNHPGAFPVRDKIGYLTTIPGQNVYGHLPFCTCFRMEFAANRQCTLINTALLRFLPKRGGGLTRIAFSLDERQSAPDVLTRIVLMNLKCVLVRVSSTYHVPLSIAVGLFRGNEP